MPLFEGNKGTLSNSYVWLTAHQEDGFNDGSEELITGFFKGGGSKNVIDVDVCREGFDALFLSETPWFNLHLTVWTSLVLGLSSHLRRSMRSLCFSTRSVHWE